MRHDDRGARTNRVELARPATIEESRSHEISGAVDTVGCEIERLEAAADTLEHKLCGVLRPNAPSGANGKEDTGGVTELGEKLMQFAVSVRRVTSRVESMLERLEL